MKTKEDLLLDLLEEATKETEETVKRDTEETLTETTETEETLTEEMTEIETDTEETTEIETAIEEIEDLTMTEDLEAANATTVEERDTWLETVKNPLKEEI